ncbi:MAG: RNA polymerase sigma factor [Bryobacteraceae bacterium]|nr:RNA polymerase sigma factor [Bryobacteraceae bacterium]
MSLPAVTFHEVYEAHGREVYRFALYLAGDAARAEDLTAEAFLRVWASPAPAQLKTIKSYLLAIVRNLYVQAWRRERRETALTEVPAPADCRDEVLDYEAELRRVLDGLQQLDPVERAAVLLRGENGMDYEEIARTLEITPVAARVKVHRARLKLMQARKGKLVHDRY